MSKELVVKRNKYGFRLILDDQIPFEELLDQVKRKFQETGDFFKDAQMAIALEGRTLSSDEEQQIVDMIESNSSITIVCIMDNDEDLESRMEKQMENIQKLTTHSSKVRYTEYNEGSVEFYRGSLRSGQVLECESNVTLIGDVNPGAKIVSPGNIVVLGSLKGNAFAGASGDNSCFIFALEMKPIQLQIGDVIAKSPDPQKKLKMFKRKNVESEAYSPQIAFTRDKRICIGPAVKGCFNY